MEATLPEELYSRIEENGKTYFTFPTGIEENRHYLKIFSDQKETPGYLIKDDTIEEWKFEGFRRQDGMFHLFGPYFEGESLESLLQQPWESLYPYLIQLLEAWSLVQKQHRSLFSVRTDLILFLKEGGILFLPVDIFKTIRGSQAEGHALQTFGAIQHPFLEDQISCSFSFAALLYKVFTGQYPFLADTHEDIKSRMEIGTVPPPHLLKFDLRQDISQWLVDVLQGKVTPTFKGWQKALTDWQKNGVTASSESTSRMTSEQAQRKIATIYKTHQRKVFVQTHRWLLISLACGFLVVFGIAYHFLSIWLEPRVTQGFPPYQVVETFYQSINTMDFMTMQDCVIDDAGDSEIDEASHMQVLVKMNQVYNMGEGLVNATEWEKLGKPKLPPERLIYGITDFSVKELSPEPKPIFQVSYTKWTPNPSSKKPNSAVINKQTPMENVVYLTQDGDDWVIYQIDYQ